MRDMKIEEKRKMKKLEIGELFKGLGELIKEGQLKMGEKELFFPESAVVELEYKEKKGRAKLEIEMKWNLEGPSLEHAKKDEQSLKEIKQFIKRSFNSLRESLNQNRLPSDQEIEGFVNLSKAFNRLAKKSAYEKDMPGFMALVARLESNAKIGRIEETKTLIEEIRAAKKSCHKSYRWKEKTA